MAFLTGGANTTSTAAYDVANSCRWNKADSAYMHKTFGTSTDVDKCTISVWLKRSLLGGTKSIVGCHTDDNNRVLFGFEEDQLQYRQVDSGSTTVNLITTQVFRDVSAWYHIVLSVDTGQSTAANRIRLYVNGSEVTDFGTETDPDQNLNFGLNNSSIVLKLVQQGEQNDFFDGYMSEFVFIDGQQLTPSSFGEFNSDSPTIWQPIDVSGLTFGTNGFYLDFESSGNLGNDANGGTDLTEVNLAATDQSTDTPTLNYPTWNPLIANSDPVYSEGNLQVYAGTRDTNYQTVISTMAAQNGKWYCEMKAVQGFEGSDKGYGIYRMDNTYVTTTGLGNYVGGYTWSYSAAGLVRTANGTVDNEADDWSDNDIMAVAMDLDNNKVYFAKNNTWINSGDPTSGATGTGAYAIINAAGSKDFYSFACTVIQETESDNPTWQANFGSPMYANSSDAADADGSGAFEYAPPSGYFAMNSKNLAEYG